MKSLLDAQDKFTILSTEWGEPSHNIVILILMGRTATHYRDPPTKWGGSPHTTVIFSPEWEGPSQTTDYTQFN